MRPFLFVLGLLLLVIGGRADDFPTDFPPTFKFQETYDDVVVADPDFPGDFLLSPRGDLFIQAVGSLSGYDQNEIDPFTGYNISVGDFEWEGLLSDDSDYDPADPNHNHIFTTTMDGLDANGDPITVWTLTILWPANRVTITLSSHNAPDQVDVASADYYPDVDEPNINRDDLIAAFGFGPFSLDFRTVHMIGNARTTTDGRVSDNLSHVQLWGAMDSVLPTVTISNPAAGAKLTVNDSPDGFYNITGTVSDTYAVNGITFPGVINAVEVKLSDNANTGDFVPAQVDSFGNWVLPNTPLILGTNFLTVRAFDEDGNTTTLPARSFKYSLQGALTVTASATGYSGVNGLTAGTVTGSFFKVGSKKLTMVVGQTAPKDSTTQNAGDTLTVTAVPGVGSVFNGWKGVVSGNTVINEVTETLHFDARPGMTLTADFVPNPFSTTLVGKYQGLFTGASAAERGTLKLALTKTGAFSATVKLGALTLPVKGKVLGSGFWKGNVTKAGKTYSITLNLSIAPNGERRISGNVSGNGLNSDFIADLNSWKGKTNEATAYVGSYTVLLPPSPDNMDTSFPIGVGFGRVVIGKLGTVAFTGKLADGSPATAASTLVKLTTGAVSFPLFISLDKGLGNVSGVVTYDNTQPTSDLSGTLDWAEPTTTGNEPQAFEGQIALNGSLYTKPPVNTRAILEASAGVGHFTIAAPAFSKPTKMIPTPLGPSSFDVTLNTLNATDPFDPSGLKPKLKINPTTGLVTGTYWDAAFKKSIPFSGAVSRKANQGGGVFIRGNRAGEILLTP